MKTPPSESSSAANASAEKKPMINFAGSKLFWPVAGLLAVALYFCISHIAAIFTHESTDDAFIAAHVISIAPRVAGQVAAVHVLDNKLVQSNEALMELDPADYAVVVAQKQAASASQEANLRAIVAAYELMRAKVATAEAAARKAGADVDASEATAKKLQADFERARDLRQQNTISQQEFDAVQAANIKAQADWKSAVENAAEETSKVVEADKQLDTILAQKEAVLAQVSESQTNVAAARLNLSYTKLSAPVAGRVTRKSVEPGDYVQAGQQVMSIVQTDVWVVANFKESQLKDMMPSQPASVKIDALNGKTFRAHVDSIQAGSGAAFSLLPPENAVGNFVKVVQRVPVKILFDEPLPADHVFGPGMSVVPSVQTGKFAFPGWASAVIAVILALAAALGFRKIAVRKPAAE
jgi:membrane fusion protein (multidrug efflux system)